MIVDAVLAPDRPGMLDRGYVLHELTAGGSLDIGPLRVETRLLRIGCRTPGSGWPPAAGCSRAPLGEMAQRHWPTSARDCAILRRRT